MDLSKMFLLLCFLISQLFGQVFGIKPSFDWPLSLSALRPVLVSTQVTVVSYPGGGSFPKQILYIEINASELGVCSLPIL